MFKIISKHKIITCIIILVVAAGSYFGYKTLKGKGGEIRYVSAAVEKGTLIVSVSGSGQISASNQVDIKSKVSGDVVYFVAKKGQEVKRGALLLKLDDSDAQKAVNDAEINLQSAELDLQKMEGIKIEEGTIRGTKEKAEDDLEKAYEDGFNTVSDIFLNLPNIMAGLQDTLFSYSFNQLQQNIDYYTDTTVVYNTIAYQYKADTYGKYQSVREEYDQNFQDYKTTSRFSEKSAIESLIYQTYETIKNIAETVKSANNLIQFYKDELTKRNLRTQSLADTHLSNLNSYTSKTNSYLLSLLSLKNTIENSKEDIINAGFDIADQEIQVKQKIEALSEAKKKLENYSVYVLFDGIIAETNIEKGDSISASTVIATLITKQKIAEITLNEVDIAKVKVGQKANITFDAIEDLNITGEVAEVDILGATTQGVITYGVKITFDTQDERVKSGMSASVAIIIDAKQDVLFVSSSAVKQQDDVSYVEIMTESAVPQPQVVTVGLSNDTMTEIISGLEEGDRVVTQTITANSSQSQSQQNTGIRIPGVTGGGGGFNR